MAALAQSLFILVSAGVIAWAAVARLLSGAPAPLAAEGEGIVVMSIAVAITLALVWWQGRVARETGNKVVAADRLHYLGDLLPGIGAIVALAASGWVNLPQIDSVVALAAAAFMVFGALRIGKGAFDALMDRRADPAVIEGIAAIARGGWPGCTGSTTSRPGRPEAASS